MVSKVQPGLVIINTTLQYSNETAAGTGMVINPGGLVLTNNHVIEGSTKITATVAATGRTYPATVIGYDKTGDIALIRLTGANGLRTIPVGNSATVTSGTQVVALGNAQGQGGVCRPRPGHRAEPDHHRERPGWLGQLGDPARDDPDQRGRRVR